MDLRRPEIGIAIEDCIKELKRTAENLVVSVDCHYLKKGKPRKQRTRKRDAKANRKGISDSNARQDLNNAESFNNDTVWSHHID